MINNYKIGIVMVNYNGSQLTIDCIDSLQKSTYSNYHIYLVDNGSHEEQLCELKRYCSKLLNVTLIDTKVNNGIAKGNNIGVTSAVKDNCNYIMLLNNDTIVDPYMLEILVHKTIKEGYELSTPLMFYYDHPQKIWCAGGKFNFYKGTTSHFHENQHIDEVELKEVEVDYVPTCCLLLKAELFKEHGFFDEKYFLYYDDTDFIYRLYRNNYKISFIPSAKLWHKVSSSSGGAESKLTIYYGNRNRLYFINKNFKGHKKLIALLFTYTTRILKLFNSTNRQVIIEAIKDFHSSKMGWKDIEKI